ncbi:MAG: transporter [Nitrospirae bacterium]|nr:transporter [Nitrospirota bacterium]
MYPGFSNKWTGILAIFFGLMISGTHAVASCGAVNCFIVIPSQASIPQKGTVTTNITYQNINSDLIDGTNGIVSAVEVEDRRINLGEHRENSTLTQITTVDLNVGITDNFAVQLTLPIVDRSHRHDVEIGKAGEESKTFNQTGLGDIRLTGKYNILSSLVNMVVVGIGVELPTGKYKQKSDQGPSIQEPSLQIGRGAVGVMGSIFQTYEIIPQVLNQFAKVSYRHTFKNSFDYQFGDEYLLSAGLNWQVLKYFVLTGQLNYRYLVHDNFRSDLNDHATDTVLDTTIRNRMVPNTGSTSLMFTPGITVQNIPGIPNTSAYINVQVPVVRDFNNNLAQNTSFLVGITHFFNVLSVFGNNAQ